MLGKLQIYPMRNLNAVQEPQGQHRAESCDPTWLLGPHAVFINWLICKEPESNIPEAARTTPVRQAVTVCTKV